MILTRYFYLLATSLYRNAISAENYKQTKILHESGRNFNKIYKYMCRCLLQEQPNQIVCIL